MRRDENANDIGPSEFGTLGRETSTRLSNLSEKILLDVPVQHAQMRILRRGLQVSNVAQLVPLHRSERQLRPGRGEGQGVHGRAPLLGTSRQGLQDEIRLVLEPFLRRGLFIVPVHDRVRGRIEVFRAGGGGGRVRMGFHRSPGGGGGDKKGSPILTQDGQGAQSRRKTPRQEDGKGGRRHGARRRRLY